MECKLSGPSTSLRARTACLPAWPARLALQGSAAGPAWTTAGEKSGSGTLEVVCSSPTYPGSRLQLPSQVDTAALSRQVFKVLSVPPSLRVWAGKRCGGKEQGKPKDLAVGRLLFGNCLGAKSPGGQPPHPSTWTCPLRTSPAASGPRRALAGRALLASSSCLALREEMEDAGCGKALRVTSFFSQAPFCRELLGTTGAAAGVSMHNARGAGADCSQSRCTSVTPDSGICLGQDGCQVLSFRQGPHSHQPRLESEPKG